MENGFNENPILWLIHLLKNITVDHFILVILIVIAMIALYYSRRIIFGIIHKIEDIYHYFSNHISKLKIRKALIKHNEKTEKEIRIANDIKKHIEMLKYKDKKLVALQYLYSYPSAAGFKAIFDIAVQEQDSEIREQLICSLCDSTRTSKWYNIQ